MVKIAEARVAVVPDTDRLVRACRVIAKHLTAMADELEAPEVTVTLPDSVTDERAAAFRERMDRAMRDGSLSPRVRREP